MGPRQVPRSRSKSLCQFQWKKTLKNNQQKGVDALLTMHLEGTKYNESYISEETI